MAFWRHLHDGLAEVHDLLVRERGGLAEVQQEVVEVLEQGDLAVQLDVDLALELPLLHLGPPGAGRRRWRGTGPRMP